MPIELYRIKDIRSDKITVRIQINEILDSPLSFWIKQIGFADELLIKQLSIKSNRIYPTDFVIKGPFVGKKYGIFKANEGYELYCFELPVTNIGKQKSDILLSGGDGAFELVDNSGTVYNEISSRLYINSEDRFVKIASEIEKTEYPIINSYDFGIMPIETVIYHKIFEIKKDSIPKVIKFKTLGEIREVRIRIDKYE